MSQGVVLRGARRRPRAALVMPLLSLAILVLGWSIFWLVERGRASAGLDAFLASEAAHGRRWTCPDRTIDGYPFTIAVSCRNVGFEGTVAGSAGHGDLGGITARVLLVKPTAVYVVLQGPMSLKTTGGRDDFTLDWERFGAKVRDLLRDRLRVEVVGEGFRLARPGNGSGTARRIEIHAGPAPAPAAADTARVDVALAGVALPELDALTGEGAPLEGATSGTITHLVGNLPDISAGAVEGWRAAGGRLEVGNVALSKGPLTLGAAGVLGLDPQRRLAGQLDARFGGFGPLMKRYGISLGAVEVGSLVANLLGAKPAPAVPPGTIALPVTFANGTVAVGPFRTGLVLPPLY